MRTLAPRLAAALAATGLLATGSPAQAGAGAFAGVVRFSCFGCGMAPGDGTFTLSPGGPFWAEFVASEQPNTCPVLGTAQGRFHGSVTGDFSWTRLGAQLVITTNGLPGSGALVVTSPVGNPCGGPVYASVSGTLVF